MASLKQVLLAGPTLGLSLRGGKKERGPTSEDIARQRERDQSLLNQFLAQLVPGSQEFLDLQAQGQEWLSQIGSGPDFTAMIRELGTRLSGQQQQRIARGEPVLPGQAQTQAQIDRLRGAVAPQPYEQDIFRILEGATPETAFGRTALASTQATPEEAAMLAGIRGETSAAPTADIFRNIVARAQTPDQYFESTLGPELELARQAVESQFARRGITPTSGLALEGLGRTGAELAVRSAQARERSRQEALENYFNALTRGQAGTERQQGASRDIFNVGEGLRERAIGTEEYLTNLQLGREHALTEQLERSTTRGLESLEGLRQRESAFETAGRMQEAQQDAQRREQLARAAMAAGGAAASIFFPPAGAATAAALTSRPSTAPSQAGFVSDLLTEQRSRPLDVSGLSLVNPGDVFAGPDPSGRPRRRYTV